MLMEDSEENLLKLYDDIYGIMSRWIVEGHSPGAIGAALMICAMRLYRTTLNDEDFNKFVDYMSDSRNRVQKLNFEDAAKKLN